MSRGTDVVATPEDRPVTGTERTELSARSGGYRDYSDEPELVRAVQAGDTDAFGVLVERYLDPGYAFALSLLRNEQDAEDGTQAAFIRALDRIGQLRPGSPFGPWFYRVLRSTCLNLRRREALREHEALPPAVSGGPSPDREFDRNRAREQVLSALDRLPEMQRQAVLLYDLEGYDHAEIAEALDIAVGTSRANLHHGRKALRRILLQSPEPDGARND